MNEKVTIKTEPALEEKDFETKETVTDVLTTRMYVLVLRHLSPIQKGIQAAHAITEYANAHGCLQQYKEWSRVDKTIVLLDVPSTDDFEDLMNSFMELGINFAVFEEEDMNNTTTALCFIADDRVYDRKKYPDFQEWVGSEGILMGMFLGAEHQSKKFEEWKEFMGGNANIRLRHVIREYRLAR